MRHTEWRSSARIVFVLTMIAMTSMLLASPALAGRNTNGRLAVHTDDAVVYTATADYCSSALPSPCEEFNANGSQGIEREQVIWFVAAFMPESSPGVTAIQFGIDHNLPAGQGYFTRWSVCGPWPLEFPDSGWPETGLGDVIGYGVPVYDHLFPFYWFAVFREDDRNYFGTRTYPATNEAKFVDDSNPPVEDLIYIFGTVRWDGAGRTGCEWGVPPEGACCYPDGTCRVQMITECQGHYQGDNTVCDPNPCPGLEACCLCDGACQMMIEAHCLAQGGVPQGPGTDCEPAICAFPPGEGACCLGQDCLLMTEWCCDLANGEFMGSETVCDPSPCLWPAACCFCDGTCQMLLEADCLAQNGLPFGPGLECETIQCAPAPVGACCFDQECQMTDERCCGLEGGVYEGFGTSCDPTPCEETPVQSTTWGRIKAGYR